MAQNKSDWFRSAAVYHVYPRSFYDANSDGVGDLRGIIQKLDYLAGKPDSLGVDAVWLSPFYPSPMVDFGYDVSDHCNVDPLFGTLEDFDELLEQAHARGLKVIVDFVPNHTSDRHVWFRESRSNLGSAKRNWYVWRDSKPGGAPPNNWPSEFGGSAWEYDNETGQYYLHTFCKEQPDLNWDNPHVREAMKDVLRFWLDKGVDGFRVDAVDWLSKDARFRDNPFLPAKEGEPAIQELRYSKGGPHLFDYLNEITDVLKEYPNRFMITESYPPRGLDEQRVIQSYVRYYRLYDTDVASPFYFGGVGRTWTAQAFRQIVGGYQSVLRLDWTPVYNMGNHDQPRLVSRFGADAARVAAMVICTVPGMAVMYYGDELGLADVPIPPEKVRDPRAAYADDPTVIGEGRDPERTPMQWNDSTYAGFSTVEPWLPVASDYKDCNVVSESSRPASLLNLYKKLLKLRGQSEALRRGEFSVLSLSNEAVFGYLRTAQTEQIAVLLNFTDDPVEIDTAGVKGVVVISTHPDHDGREVGDSYTLLGHEGIVVRTS